MVSEPGRRASASGSVRDLGGRSLGAVEMNRVSFTVAPSANGCWFGRREGRLGGSLELTAALQPSPRRPRLPAACVEGRVHAHLFTVILDKVSGRTYWKPRSAWYFDKNTCSIFFLKSGIYTMSLCQPTSKTTTTVFREDLVFFCLFVFLNFGFFILCVWVFACICLCATYVL